MVKWLFRLVFPVCLLITSGVHGSSEIAEPGTDGFSRSSFVPYWYIDEHTTSTIEIKNVMDSEVSVLPVLTTRTGERIELPAVTIPPRHVRQLPIVASYLPDVAHETRSDLRDGVHWGDGSRPMSHIGSAELKVLHPENAGDSNLAAWILVENADQGLGLVSTFHGPAVNDGTTSEFNGLWWLPSENAQAYYALQKTHRRDLAIDVLLTADDVVAAKERITIPAGRNHLIDIVGLIGPRSAPAVGSIKLRYETRVGDRGSLLGRGIVVDENRRFNTPLKLHQAKGGYLEREKTEIHAPLAYFGNLGYLVPGSTDVVTPYLLVSNTGSSSVPVRGAVNGRSQDGDEQSFYLDTMELPEHGTRLVNLETLRQSADDAIGDGVAGLRLWHDKGPNDVIAEVINVSDSWNMALYDRTTNTAFYDATELAAISIQLHETAHGLIVLKNTTDQIQRPTVLLDFEVHGDPYSVPNVEIAPQQVQVIDIKALRDRRQEGNFGLVLPEGLEHASARIIGEPGAIVGSDPSVIFWENTTVIDHAPSCLVLVSNDPLGGGGSPPKQCRIRDLDGDARVSITKSETLTTPLESFAWKGSVSVNRTSPSVISASATGSLTQKSTSTEVVKVLQRGTVSCDDECQPKLQCNPPDCDDHGSFCIDGNCGPGVTNPRIAEARVLILDGDSLFVDELPVDYGSFAQTLGPDFDDRQGTDIIRITRKYKCERKEPDNRRLCCRRPAEQATPQPGNGTEPPAIDVSASPGRRSPLHRAGTQEPPCTDKPARSAPGSGCWPKHGAALKDP